MKIGGRSKRTFENYKAQLNKLFNYYDENIHINKLKEDDLLIFFKSNFIDNNHSSSNLNVAICSIRFLFSICFDKELNKKKLPNFKSLKRLPVFVPKDLFITIFNNEKSIRHKCWLLLAFCSGLRVNEIATLKIENIYPKEHKLKVLGKGGKERYTRLPNIVIKCLRSYCKKYNITKKEGYLFKCHCDTDIPSSGTIINYFTNLMKKYDNFGTYTFHSLRHSFATYYLRSGGSLLKLQSMMGHTNLNTTTIYLHLTQNFEEVHHV